MMNETYKPYTAKRWTEIPLPKQVRNAGCKELTEGQKDQYHRDLEKLMKESGVLKPDGSLK